MSEAESHSEECRESNGHQYFGIKSYLHNFYENVRNSDLDDFDEDRYEEGRRTSSKAS